MLKTRVGWRECCAGSIPAASMKFRLAAESAETGGMIPRRHGHVASDVRLVKVRSGQVTA
jgi:hypothetical protein